MGQFVDDVVLSEASGNESQLAFRITDMVADFANMSKTAKFSFSSGKPKIVASSFSLAKKIAAGLKKAGISNFSASVSVKDLGVDFAGGRRRTVLVRNSRLKKALVRLKAIKGMAQTNYTAKKLATTGAMPQALWDSSATGLPMSEILPLQRAFAGATGIGGTAACNATRIQLA